MLEEQFKIVRQKHLKRVVSEHVRQEREFEIDANVREAEQILLSEVTLEQRQIVRELKEVAARQMERRRVGVLQEQRVLHRQPLQRVVAEHAARRIARELVFEQNFAFVVEVERERVLEKQIEPQERVVEAAEQLFIRLPGKNEVAMREIFEPVLRQIVLRVARKQRRTPQFIVLERR